MPTEPAIQPVETSAGSGAPANAGGIPWRQMALAALLMVSTLPGRTQGLGLITVPFLKDLHLGEDTYANIHFWATILGALFCLPVGWLLDRAGLRRVSTVLVLLLAAVVGAMSALGGNVAAVFVLLLLTRGFGQSALSVASITAAGKGRSSDLAMAVYSIFLSLMFMAAFPAMGAVVQSAWGGWRMAWALFAVFLAVIVAPLVGKFLQNPAPFVAEETAPPPLGGVTLGEALRQPAFWIFSGGIALYALVASGLGLFNESVLGERGFDAKVAYLFLGLTAGVALLGQFLCGWAARWCAPGRLLAVSMFLYAAGLATLPWLQTQSQLWIFAAVFGVAGGMVMVIFFAVWGQVFGRAQLGRIQGVAQMITVFASAIGPILFVESKARYQSYTPMLLVSAGLVVLIGILAWMVKLRPAANPARLNS